MAELEALDLDASSSDVRDPLDFEISSGGDIVLAATTEARLLALGEGLPHIVHSLGDIALSTNPETGLSLLGIMRAAIKDCAFERALQGHLVARRSAMPFIYEQQTQPSREEALDLVKDLSAAESIKPQDWCLKGLTEQ